MLIQNTNLTIKQQIFTLTHRLYIEFRARWTVIFGFKDVESYSGDKVDERFDSSELEWDVWNNDLISVSSFLQFCGASVALPCPETIVEQFDDTNGSEELLSCREVPLFSPVFVDDAITTLLLYANFFSWVFLDVNVNIIY